MTVCLRSLGNRYMTAAWRTAYTDTKRKMTFCWSPLSLFNPLEIYQMIPIFVMILNAKTDYNLDIYIVIRRPAVV